ncbi:MAG: phospholipase D-like domain-containing protein [Promethearchaeota archaeon]
MKRARYINIHVGILLGLSVLALLAVNTNAKASPQQNTPRAATTGAQGVVDYFRSIFINDWAAGEAYSSATDGTGYAKSRDVSGSPNFQRKAGKLVTGNASITPVLSPDSSETKILELINGATSSLYIQQMYIYDSLTNIVDAIISAHDRGVTCRVLLGEGKDDENGAVASRLNSAGVAVKECDGTSPLYFDTVHNKGVIVDGEKVLVASINWSPTSLRENREAGLVIESAEVAAYYTELFNADWDGSDPYDSGTSFKAPAPGGSDSAVEAVAPVTPEPEPATYTNKFTDPKTYTGTMSVRCLSSPDNCYDALVTEIGKATQSLDVSVYTFSSPFLMDAVADAIARGVQVRLLLGKPFGSTERNYNRWTLMNFTEIGVPSASDSSKNNTALGLWASSDFTYQHCKYAIIDNKTLVLSSGNWSQNSCPKPDEDDEVYGNRDWWVVVYGSGATGYPEDVSSNDFFSDLPGFPASVFVPVALLGVVFVLLRRKS